ncbi:MAG TPA: hypothetical protein VH351_16610, partial [Bryobacteraceae bacterium]|nr:hypothetical protein [Bryobacteraceae bacterium]
VPCLHATNLIDSTYGSGAGSFELGDFVNNGNGVMELGAGALTINGWIVGGPTGVDWDTKPLFGAQDGLYSLDLIEYAPGSIMTAIPTNAGQSYDLSFYATTVSTGTALGTVSAGTLVNQPFTAPITSAVQSDDLRFVNEAFALFSFRFTATKSVKMLSFAATPLDGTYCNPDCLWPRD